MAESSRAGGPHSAIAPLANLEASLSARKRKAEDRLDKEKTRDGRPCQHHEDLRALCGWDSDDEMGEDVPRTKIVKWYLMGLK
jgi:hypothetical protein